MRPLDFSNGDRSGRRVSRRSFLGGVAVGVSATAVPLVVPASSLGKDGAVAPSNRIGLGVIGCGGKGTGGMRNFMRLDDVRVAALADPKATNRGRAAELAKVDPKSTYADFRELLARPDVDAVLVATPDHWHVLASIAAAKAGKDVYCEKPLANTIAEGRALVEAVNRYGVVFQHGTQLRSMIGTRMACELVRNGRLGELKSVRIGSPPGKAIAPQEPMPVPDWLDYDLWLGPAPMAPYTTERCTTGWYFISDYSKSGWVAGFGVHDIDIAQWALGLERTGPVEIEGHGVFPTEGLFDTVLTYRLDYRYANGATITVTDTARNRHGVLFEGARGTIFTRGGIECNPPELLQEKIRPNEQHLYASLNHEANFIECVKSRATTITPAEVAHRSCSTCLLGGIALKLGRRLRWDPAAERFVNDPEADRLLAYAMREPWTV